MGSDNEKWRTFVGVMLVSILASVVGFGTFSVIRIFGPSNVKKADESRIAQQISKAVGNNVTVSLPQVIKDGKYTIEWIESGRTELTGNKDDYLEIDFDATETISSIREISLPKTPYRFKTKNFTGFKSNDKFFETDIFTAALPEGWDACCKGDCIYLYDKKRQTERLYLFTLRSIKMTKADYSAFLDKVFANHKKLKSYTINGNGFVYSLSSKDNKYITTLLKPLDSDFGLMFQCHSSTNMLTSKQKQIVSSIRLKNVTELKPTPVTPKS